MKMLGSFLEGIGEKNTHNISATELLNSVLKNNRAQLVESLESGSITKGKFGLGKARSASCASFDLISSQEA